MVCLSRHGQNVGVSYSVTHHDFPTSHPNMYMLQAQYAHPPMQSEPQPPNRESRGDGHCRSRLGFHDKLREEYVCRSTQSGEPHDQSHSVNWRDNVTEKVIC
jgi:hypothetical protein